MLSGTVGQYRVLRRIGGGGMGEVYQAFDTELKRAVALKAIREKHAGDPNWMRRLEKEAQAVASIDHPYICTIHNLVEHAGQVVIVMEYVQGETLQEKLRSRPLEIQTALAYVREVAEGLAAAHDRGLVHRDIKPANIMITEHDHVKVMDFGLAKILQEGEAEKSTASTALTDPGGVVGTPHYMAPEQALGGRLDARSDLFSLGVVLFRALTGELPFVGETRSAYLSHLLSGEPRPLSDLLPGAPPGLEALLARALAKDPKDRFSDVRELARALERLRAPALSTSPGAPRRPLWLVAALVLPLLLLLTLWLERSPRAPLPDLEASVRALVTWPGPQRGARFSPDLTWISFISKRGGRERIWVKPLEEEKAIPLATVGRSISGTLWSPEGKRIAYLEERAHRVRLHVVPAFFGGTSQFDLPLPGRALRLVRWTGEEIFFEGAHALYGLDLTSREVKQTVRPGAPLQGARDFDVNPKGSRVVFSGYANGETDLWTMEISGGGLRRLTHDAYLQTQPRWLPDSGLVYRSNRSGQMDLWYLREGRPSRSLTSSPEEEILEDVAGDGSRLLFSIRKEEGNLWVRDAAGERQWTADSLIDLWPSLSADGTRVAFQRSPGSLPPGFLLAGTRLFESRILLGRVNKPTLTEVSREAGRGYRPRLSPDGRWLTYLKEVSGHTQLWLLDLESRRRWPVSNDYSSAGFITFPAEWTANGVEWLPDSTRFFFVEGGGAAGPSLLSCLPGPSQPSCTPLLAPDAANLLIYDLRLGRRGQFLAYVSHSSTGGKWQVHVLDRKSGRDRIWARRQGPRWVGSPGWRRDSLLVLEEEPQGSVVQIMDPGGGVHSLWREPLRLRSVRYDSASDRLLALRSLEGVENLFSYALPAGGWEALTSNRQAGISLSGITVAAGKIVFVRARQRRDIWMMQFQKPDLQP